MKPVIEVLVGMVASGKSTYAKQRANEGAITISDDATVLSVHGGNYKLYDSSLKPLYKGVEIQTLIMAIMIGRDVVVDKVCCNPAKRAKWINLANMLDVGAVCTLFPFAGVEEHTRRRMAHDNRGYTADKWSEVIIRHLSEYEPPTLAEGFTSIREM